MSLKIRNSNIEIQNPKWFDRLTILSVVEGQIRMTKILNEIII